MPAVSIPSHSTLPKPDDADFEPDEEWKRQLRKRIEGSLESMVQDVKDNQAAQLRKQVVTEENRLQLEEEYKQAMVNIKMIASEQYRMELDRERNQRRWTAGKPINPQWTRILEEEQHRIMNTIKQNSNHDPSPTEERRPTLPTTITTKPDTLSSYESTTTPLRTVPLVIPTAPPPATPDSKEERDRLGAIAHEPPPLSSRRGSDARGVHPRDRGDRPGSIRRQRGPSHSRSRNPADDPESPDIADHSEELRPPPRSRTLVPDPLPLSENNNRWEASLGRTGSLRSAASFTARSPPKLPEVWKPATPLEDDPSSVKSYHLGRRGSSASIKSTGSGASVRPTISATIPERVDDADDSGFTDRSNYEHERPRKFTDKDRRGGRKNSRPTPVDPTSYAEDPPASSPLKSAGGGGGSVVMQLATGTPIKSLSSKASFVNGDERYYRDHSARESTYRESPYSSRDMPPSSRPIPSRTPYSPEDRGDHGGPYTHRPPKTPFREYPHHHNQSSYPLDERRRERDWELDRERERDWDDDREYGRDREYDHRDRDWDRDRDNYSDSRHQYSYLSRSATYPTPPSSIPRPDHHVNDPYDDRDTPNRNYGSGYRGHGSSSSPPDDWDYQRLESSRPVPTTQPSYSRRDDPDRDQYSRPYTSSSSIPIAPRHAPSEDPNGPAWKDWGAETRRPSESRYDGFPRSPPSAEPFPTRRRPHYYNDDTAHNNTTNNNGGRRRSRPPHLADDSRRDHDHRREKEGDRSEEEEEEEESSNSDRDQSGSDGSEDDMEEQTRRLEEERRQADKRIREKALEIKRLQEEEQRLEDEAKRKEEEVKRKEDEVRRKDEEAKRVEQELQRMEEEAKRTAEAEQRTKEETRRKEREMRRKEQDANRKIADANKLVMEAGRKAEEARKKEDEINRKEEQTRKKEEKLREDAEKTRRMQQEATRIAEQARLKQETLRQMEEETRRKEQEIEERERALKAREDELKKREEEARRLREEARRLEEEAWRKEEEARRKEEEVRRKEQEARKKEEDVRKKEEEARKKEEEARRKEETRRREEEARRKEETRKREEEAASRVREERHRREEEAASRVREERHRREEEAASRMREERHRRETDMKRGDTDRFFDEGLFEDVDSKFVEEQARLLQQAQYRKREEEIRRSREERKRQDSIGNDSAWTSSSTSPGVSKSSFPQFANSQVPQYSSPSPAPSSTSAAWTTWGTHPSKTPNPTTSTASPTSARSASSGVPPPLNRPRNGSITSGSHPTSASPHSAAPISESEWARRHAEFTNDQQERFRREQERMEADRQLKAAGKPLSRDEIQRVFEHHDRLWSRLPSISELSWVDFPWPVLRPPSNPDDISFGLVNAYFSAPFLPEKEKARSLKDRIKEHLRRWHPDRFESKVLPRVLDGEKEKVKQGAGNVVRYLNDLLRKENETANIPKLFGE